MGHKCDLKKKELIGELFYSSYIDYLILPFEITFLLQEIVID